MDHTRAEVICTVAHLKGLCDERGHALLDALQDLCLAQCDLRDDAEKLVTARRSHLSDLDGYSLGDPKRGMLENGNGRPW